MVAYPKFFQYPALVLMKNFQSAGGSPPRLTYISLGSSLSCPEGSAIRAKLGVNRGISAEAVEPAALAYCGTPPAKSPRLLIRV